MQAIRALDDVGGARHGRDGGKADGRGQDMAWHALSHIKQNAMKMTGTTTFVGVVKDKNR